MDKKRILIVDDEKDILRTTSFALEDEGYEVYTAGDAEEGMEKLRQVRPDLILLDLILPGKSGFQIAQQIKSMEQYRQIPIMVISCKTDFADKRVAARSGMVEYVEKPLDLDKLIFHIRDLLAP